MSEQFNVDDILSASLSLEDNSQKTITKEVVDLTEEVENTLRDIENISDDTSDKVMIDVGHIKKDSEAYRKLAEAAQKVFRRSSVTDKEIRMFLLFLLGTRVSSRTVSASETGRVSQYNGINYFGSETINFDLLNTLIRGAYLSSDEDTDIGQLILDLQRMTRLFITATSNRAEEQLRKEIAVRMKEDGMTSAVGRV